VAALRAAWGAENALPDYDGLYADTDWGRMIAAHDGEYDHFTPSWTFPKPRQGSIPVALGLAGPLGTRLAATCADIWGPVDTALLHEGKPDVEYRIGEFRCLLEEAGRDPAEVNITLFNISGVTTEMLDLYQQVGVERFVFGPPTFMRHSAAETLRELDRLQPLVEKYSPPV